MIEWKKFIFLNIHIQFTNKYIKAQKRQEHRCRIPKVQKERHNSLSKKSKHTQLIKSEEEKAQKLACNKPQDG